MKKDIWTINGSGGYERTEYDFNLENAPEKCISPAFNDMLDAANEEKRCDYRVKCERNEEFLARQKGNEAEAGMIAECKEYWLKRRELAKSLKTQILENRRAELESEREKGGN